MSQLEQRYRDQVVPQLMADFGYANRMAVPRLVKVTLNMGVGEAAADRKIADAAAEELALIAGQKPVITLARKSVASFKIRDGWPVGCKVTLRRDRMYDFFERLVHIAIPRIRDFRGLSHNSFDGRGNYNFGITEQITFPEIDFDRVSAIRGLDVAITTSAGSDDEGKALLTALDFPFRK